MTALCAFVVALLCVLALYSAEHQEKLQAREELARADMELYVTNFAVSERQRLEKEALDNAEKEKRERIALTDAMIEKDSRELLLLVNPENKLPEGYSARPIAIGDGKYIDERAWYALKEMIADCKASGCNPVPISGYRTHDYQQELYDNKIQRLIWDGWSYEDAPAEAAKSVAVPDTSEHQLGFAIDIIDYSNPNLDITQEWTRTQRWLMSNCTRYGFILRYPNDTTDITGIIYEPWHYRYVGKKVAADYAESGCSTFEEFLEVYNP